MFLPTAQKNKVQNARNCGNTGPRIGEQTRALFDQKTKQMPIARYERANINPTIQKKSKNRRLVGHGERAHVQREQRTITRFTCDRNQPQRIALPGSKGEHQCYSIKNCKRHRCQKGCPNSPKITDAFTIQPISLCSAAIPGHDKSTTESLWTKSRVLSIRPESPGKDALNPHLTSQIMIGRDGVHSTYRRNCSNNNSANKASQNSVSASTGQSTPALGRRRQANLSTQILCIHYDVLAQGRTSTLTVYFPPLQYHFNLQRRNMRTVAAVSIAAVHSGYLPRIIANQRPSTNQSRDLPVWCSNKSRIRLASHRQGPNGPITELPWTAAL